MMDRRHLFAAGPARPLAPGVARQGIDRAGCASFMREPFRVPGTFGAAANAWRAETCDGKATLADAGTGARKPHRVGTNRTMIAGSHADFPGLGHVARDVHAD